VFLSVTFGCGDDLAVVQFLMFSPLDILSFSQYRLVDTSTMSVNSIAVWTFLQAFYVSAR